VPGVALRGGAGNKLDAGEVAPQRVAQQGCHRGDIQGSPVAPAIVVVELGNIASFVADRREAADVVLGE
jgi:hypothetical protein